MIVHKPHGPYWDSRTRDWVWWLNGKWHRYYGCQSFMRGWWIHGKRIK